MPSEASASVVIIGAGQAGLAVAYYLLRHQLKPMRDFIMYDRGPLTGGAWQHRWDGLRLGSTHWVSDLPGMRQLGLTFENADRALPAKDIVAGYYRRYEAEYELRVQRPVTVHAVANDGPDLLVHHSEGVTRAQVIVNASGTWGAPFIPYYPGVRNFTGRQLHTANYVGPEDFADQSVIVVGGGTSAVSTLLELEHVAAKTMWATRRPVNFLDTSPLRLEGRSDAVAIQEQAARSGQPLPSIVSGTGVPRTRRIVTAIERGLLKERPMFVSVEETGVHWSDGEHSPSDAIIWATGFRPELRHLAPLRLREKAGGITVEGSVAWLDARVFLAGYGPHASTSGANLSGRVIARKVLDLL